MNKFDIWVNQERYIYIYLDRYISIYVLELINRPFLPNLHDTQQYLSVKWCFTRCKHIKWPLVPSMPMGGLDQWARSIVQNGGLVIPGIGKAGAIGSSMEMWPFQVFRKTEEWSPWSFPTQYTVLWGNQEPSNPQSVVFKMFDLQPKLEIVASMHSSRVVGVIDTTNWSWDSISKTWTCH